MRISMPRGDIRNVPFEVVNEDDSPCETNFDEIIMTCKKCYKDSNVLFQKKLSRGEIMKLDVGQYEYKIMPSDTENLTIGDYEFDIVIFYQNEIKQTTCGTLTLTKDVTHAADEVST